MKNPFNWLTARNTALECILDNARTDREVSDLYLNLISDEYTKYGSWDKYNDNFKSISLKEYSLVSQIRQVINGMINEIKRLEKENKDLNGRVIPHYDEFWQWMIENKIMENVKKEGVSWSIQINDSYHAFKDNFDLFNIWYNHIRPNTHL